MWCCWKVTIAFWVFMGCAYNPAKKKRQEKVRIVFSQQIGGRIWWYHNALTKIQWSPDHNRKSRASCVSSWIYWNSCQHFFLKNDWIQQIASTNCCVGILYCIAHSNQHENESNIYAEYYATQILNFICWFSKPINKIVPFHVHMNYIASEICSMNSFLN